jgi:hypothetical protein
MSVDVWIPKFECLHKKLTEKELDFIEGWDMIDGCYTINDEMLDNAEKELSEKEREEMKDLIDALRKGVKENDGELSFVIF